MDTLVEAAAQVFDREGLAATTNRIAERAGYSIGTLYQYFPDKQALLLALAERHVAAADARLRAVFDELGGQPPQWRRTVHAVVTAVVDLHGARPGLHRVMYRYAPRSVDGVRRLDSLHTMVVAGLARELRRCGWNATPDADQLAGLLTHAVEAQLHQVLLQQMPDSETVGATLLRTAEALVGPELQDGDLVATEQPPHSDRLHPDPSCGVIL